MPYPAAVFSILQVCGNLQSMVFRKVFVALLLLACTAPGRAAVAVEITLEGLDEAQTRNVLEQLTLQLQKDHPLTTEEYVKTAHQRAPQEIRRALEPFGYYRARVKSTLETTATGMHATYQVDLGKPLPVSRVTIRLSGEGSDDAELRAIADDFPLHRKDTLHHGLYEAGKTQLQQAAAERGYLDADFETHRIEIDLEAYEASIDLHFVTGARYHFGAITFNQDILSSGFLERHALLREGDPYSVTALLEMQGILYESGYFSRADVVPRIADATDHRVPVDINLTARPRNRYTAGLGYGTDTGGRALAGWENRRINRHGHRFATDLLYTEINNTQTLRYIIPVHFYNEDQVTITANRFHEFLPDRDELARNLTVGRGWTSGLLRTTVAATLSKEDFTFGEVREETRLLIPSISWTYTDTDDRLYATQGKRYTLDLRGAHRDAWSDITFFQIEARAKWIHRFDNAARLITRGALGHTTVGEFDELPSSLRFFTGGDRTIRGYAYESIGPTDGEGVVIGGKNLFEASVEYEYPLAGNWHAAAFYDAGNAFDENDQITPLYRGAGVGIRWRTVIGLIRLDVAWPLQEQDREHRFHLVIGPDL